MGSRRRRALFVWFSGVATVFAAGCVSDGPAPTGGEPPLGELGRLEILPAPNPMHAASVAVDRDAVSESPVVPLRYDLALGWGEGYAEDLELRLQPYVVDDECEVILADFEIEEAAAQSDGVGASWVSSTSIVISPERPGQSETIVRGRMTVFNDGALGACADLFDGTVQPFELRIRTSVMEAPPAVEIEVGGPCESSATRYIQSGATLRGTQARPLDQNGEPFVFANAYASAQVPLTVVADAETFISIESETGGVSGLVVDGQPGLVTIASQTGTTEELELVGDDDVTSADVAFGLGGGSPKALVDGGVYDGAQGNADFIFALSSGTYMGATALCTNGVAGDFRMSAPPTSACSVPSDGEQHLQKFYPEGMDGTRVGVDLRVDRSGLCEFTVDAPAFGGGQGWSTSLAVTIENADGLNGTGRD